MGAPANTVADVTPALGGHVVKEVFDQGALFAFREMNIFRGTVQLKRSTGEEPMPGNPITFTKIRALALATAPLSETTDPSHVPLQGDQVSVTLVEQGNTSKATKKMKLTSFVNIDLVAVREITLNMEESIDVIARNVAMAGTNVRYVGQTQREDLLAANVFTASEARRARATLRKRSTPPPMGSPYYVGYINPDVGYDFQQDAGPAPWQDPHKYREDVSGIFTGELGLFAGIRWVETANGPIVANQGGGVALATSAAADDIIDTAAAHGFVAGQAVQFTSLTGGAGLTADTTYYVIAANLGAQTFQVSTTPGGSAALFTTDITAGEVTAIDVYQTLVVGLQALGEGVADAQHVVITGPFDDLGRFVSVGWYYFGGFGRIREESLQRIESSSSIGEN